LVKLFVMRWNIVVGEAFPRFNFIQYGRQVLSYVLVKVTVNAPLV